MVAFFWGGAIIVSNFLRRITPFKSVPWEIQLIKDFFWHSLDKDVSCDCPLQGASNASIRKMKIGEYHLAWQKATDILKQDGHLLFGGQKIREGIKDKEIEDIYERLMSPSDDSFEIFFLLLYRLG